MVLPYLSDAVALSILGLIAWTAVRWQARATVRVAVITVWLLALLMALTIVGALRHTWSIWIGIHFILRSLAMAAAFVFAIPLIYRLMRRGLQ